MDHVVIFSSLRRTLGLAALLVSLAAISLGCQAGSRLVQIIQPEALAAPAASPTPTPALTPARGVGQGAQEEEAASKMIPPLQADVPRGPRKQPPARLIIPSIGVDTKVIELNTHFNEKGELVWETAPFSAGHHVGTANPGEVGNTVISGHISSTREGAVFARLPQINVGDGVVIVTRDRDYVYQVVDKRVVEPDLVEVMNSSDQEIVTLLTCVPDGIYSHRLVVTARRV